jgi:hypothetical protein
LLKDQQSYVARRVQAMLFEFWSRKDPRAALSTLLTLTEGSERRTLLQTVQENWGAAEPEAAVARVRQLPAGERRDAAMGDVIGGLARRDLPAAIKLLEDLPPGASRTIAGINIRRACRDTHPEAEAVLTDQAGTLVLHPGLFNEVARAAACRSVSEALAWAQSLNDPSDRDRALAGIVARMAETQPQEAIQLMMSQPNADSRAQMAGPLAATLAEGDLQAAVDWIKKLPEGPLRHQAWEGMSWEWIAQDPERAADFALSSLPAGETRTAALARVASNSLGKSWDEQAAVQWASQLPAGTDRDAFLSGLCEPRDPFLGWRVEQAARFTALMSPGQTQSATIEKIAREWLKIDAEASRAWLQQTSLPAERKQRLLKG